ncbi:MAG TPA: hypothetical protein VFG43_16565, partial [Geminicoccaceae bacterium]|nr:hypothetical protein [Geminicoccaceae bacterium]
MPATVLAREIPWLEPAWAFAALARLAAPVWLDSALPGPRQGRWSYVAADPFLLLRSKDGRITADERMFTGDPFATLARLLQRFPLAHDPALPPFQTGAIGWLGYDLCHHLERLPAPESDDLRFPDLMLGLYDTILAFDLQEQRAWLLSSGFPETAPEAQMARRRARSEQFLWLVERAVPLPEPATTAAEIAIRSNFTRTAYEAAVQRTIDYILAGDIFQANISQR